MILSGDTSCKVAIILGSFFYENSVSEAFCFISCNNNMTYFIVYIHIQKTYHIRSNPDKMMDT